MAEVSSFGKASEDPPAIRLEDRPEERSAFAEVSEDKPQFAPRWESVEAGIAEGKALLEQGDVAGAVALWEQVSEAFPESVAAFQGPGSFLLQAKRFAEARNVLSRGLERFPGDRRIMIDLGSTLHHLRAWPEALEAWAALSRAHPTEWLGILGGATTLRQLNRFEEAEALLLEGREQLGEHPACEVDLAWVAAERKDWAVAIERWERVREKRPDQVAAYLSGALALRESARFDEAEALLTEARGRFPEHQQVLVDLAHLAFRRRDFEAAVRVWAEVRAQFPQNVDGYIWGASALRQLGHVDAAEGLLLEGRQKLPRSFAIARDLAHLKRHLGKFSEALAIWEEARDLVPDSAEPYVRIAGVLREMGRYEAAAEILEQGISRFPGDRELLLESAWLARARKDWQAALGYWEQVLELAPELAVGWTGAGLALRQLGRHDEADGCLAEATRRFPNEAACWVDYAEVARARGDYPSAAARFAKIRELFPDHWAGYVVGSQCLRAIGREDEADVILRSAEGKVKDDRQVVIESARIAERRRDWLEAERLWDHIGIAYPDMPVAPAQKSLALRMQGRVKEAVDLVRSSLARFPDSPELIEQGALNAMVQEHWASALESLRGGLARFPDHQGIRQRLFEVQLRLCEDGIMHWPVAGSVEVAEDDPRGLVMQFESLGGHPHGCEFGIFQQRMGAEPLGLLRWADTPPEFLIKLLATEFEGFGQPEHTDLYVAAPPVGRPEYWFCDPRWKSHQQLFMYPDEISKDRAKVLLAKRTSFLRRKLIEDLQRGEKIFVYKSLSGNIASSCIAV